MRARSGLLLLIAVAAVVLLVGRTATALVVDHAWFDAMGAPTLFWEQLLDTALLQGGAWIVGSLFAFANLHAVRRTILAVAVPSRVANIELTAMVPGRRLLSATIVLAMIVGAVLALPLTNWETLALARHGLPFGEIEGIFDRDLGHYVYWLPFEETLYLWSLVSVVALTAMVLVLYALTRSLRLEGRRIAASTHVRRHLSVLGALVLLLLAWSYRLDAFDLLLAGSGPDGLFLRVDHRVTLRMDSVLAYGAAIAALIVLRTGWVGQLRAAFVTLTVVLVSAVGLRHAVPSVLARGDTLGDPARRDADYVAARALYSRRAYDVELMRTARTDSTLLAMLPTATATLGARAAVWDDATLVEAFGAEAPAAPAERGRGDISARPAATDGAGAFVEAAAPTWSMVNGQLSALRVERPTVSGAAWRISLVEGTRPQLRDSVLPPPDGMTSRTSGGWPLVAPGASGARLLDAATEVEVPGAVLDAPLMRVSHAWALRDLALLRAESLATTPLLVTHRDVRDRVRRLAPVFVQGTSVYMVRDGTQWFWVLHLYSASDRYPFSQRWQVGEGVYTYFKLAATAVVDASTGRVRLVPVARPDAVARTWMTRLPRLFTPVSALPASLASRLPPANDAAEVQTHMFARYGSRFEGSVRRRLPDSAFVHSPPPPVQLSSRSGTITSWSVALLDERDAVAGVVTATGGAAAGVVWTPAPSGSPVLVWPAVLGRLREALDSARARRGTPGGGPQAADSVGAGTPPPPSMLGRPEIYVTTRGLLVRQTMTGLGSGGRPQLEAVALTDGAAVGVGPSMADALRALGESVDAPTAAAPPPGMSGGPPGDAARWYDAMRQAMRQGNWNAFGAAFDSLGRSLGRPPQ